jgi:hypothetical protein
MGLFGRDKPTPGARTDQPQSVDEQAIARYRYMLKTAPPETIEQAHAEAFAQLTPEQRRLVLQQITDGAPASERAAVAQGGTDPQALARMATRAEIRQPGAMERMFGQAGGMSLGGLVAGSLLGSIAGTVIGSMIAREFFAHEGHGAGGLDGGRELSQESGLAESDHAGDGGADFDAGTFDV